jgi:hypothetical protein
MVIAVPLSGHAAPGRLPRRRVIALAIAFAAVFLGGCSGSHWGASVDPERAREALKTTLDVWKKGDKPTDLTNNSPAITAQDLDWMGGATLVDYQVTGDGRSVEGNLYVPVTLTLKTEKGKEVKKKVTYVVTTSPNLSVFRALD